MNQAITINRSRRSINQFGHFVMAVILVALLAGCGSHTVAFRVDAELSGRDATGAVWKSNPEEFSRRIGSVAKREGSTFETYIAYDGSKLGFSLSTLAGGVRMSILNKRDAPMCLRLDIATLQSNFSPEPRPMKVWSASFNGIGVVERFDIKQFRKGTQVSYLLTPYCIPVNGQVVFNLNMDSSELFPNAQLFNVRFVHNHIVESGVGNTLKFSIPLEVGGKLEAFEISLKATDHIYYNYSM